MPATVEARETARHWLRRGRGRRARRPQAGAAVRRAGPAGGGRPGPGRRSAAAAARRAAGGPRRRRRAPAAPGAAARCWPIGRRSSSPTTCSTRSCSPTGSWCSTAAGSSSGPDRRGAPTPRSPFTARLAGLNLITGVADARDCGGRAGGPVEARSTRAVDRVRRAGDRRLQPHRRLRLHRAAARQPAQRLRRSPSPSSSPATTRSGCAPRPARGHPAAPTSPPALSASSTCTPVAASSTRQGHRRHHLPRLTLVPRQAALLADGASAAITLSAETGSENIGKS